MPHRFPAILAAAVVAATSLACGSSGGSSTPTTPTVNANPVPKFTAPSVQSPTNDQMASSLTPTLTAGTASVDLSGYTLQYRFQLYNDAGTLVGDSGLMGDPSWTTGTLTPNKRYTWKVRAESQGWAGPWSSDGAFRTPDPPPAYNRPIGNWQACAGKTAFALVECVWNAVRPIDSVGDLEVVKRVAWLGRGEGMGLLIKASGENVVLWQGYSLSATRICFPDGHIYKIISDAGPGGANTPTWSDNGFVERSLYVPAIDPSKP
jgi:hypothetical protein